MPNEHQAITAADFGEEFADYEPELQEQAVEIANGLQSERPETPKEKILSLALQRARTWWMDRAG